jgi:hypothetical protein
MSTIDVAAATVPAGDPPLSPVAGVEDNPPPPPPPPPANDGVRPLIHESAWQAGMWKGVGIALGIAGLLLIGLVATSIYRTTSIIDAHSGADLAFTFSGLGIINNTLLRLLAMLIGAGIIFGGLAVSFFSSSDSNRISLQALPAAGESFKAMVATHTPGIVGIFMGGIIIIAALFARSTNSYSSPERIEVTSGNMQQTRAQANTPPLDPLPSSSELRKQFNESLKKEQAGKP